MWMCITGPPRRPRFDGNFPPLSWSWNFFYIRGEQNKNKQNFSEDERKTLPARQSSLKLTCDASCIGQHRILHTLKISFAFFSRLRRARKNEKIFFSFGGWGDGGGSKCWLFSISTHAEDEAQHIVFVCEGKIFRLCIHFPFTSLHDGSERS